MNEIRKSKRQPKLPCRHQETVDSLIQLIFHKRGARAGDDARALFLRNTAEERAEFSGSVPIASSSATSDAKFYSRSHNAVIRVYDEVGNVIQTHEQNGEFCGP
jgi:hypothetical protein